MLIASKALQVKTLKDLIAYAKANPGKARYASPGVGLSGQHFPAALQLVAVERGFGRGFSG